jgi:hypothetical protein
LLNGARRLKDGLAFMQAAAATFLRRSFTRADVKRWSSNQNLSSDWDSRTITLAASIPPSSKVLEFGAGRMVLREHLPPGCSYTPSDLVDREPGVCIVCDLNAPTLPDFGRHDVVVFSGVLEYVTDVPRLLSHLAGSCRLILASYAVASGKGTAEVIGRRRLGWWNDYTAEELVAVFRECGFEVSQIGKWGGQNLYKLERARPPQ